MRAHTHTYMYICIYVCVCMYVCIYIYRERERDEYVLASRIASEVRLKGGGVPALKAAAAVWHRMHGSRGGERGRAPPAPHAGNARVPDKVARVLIRYCASFVTCGQCRRPGRHLPATTTPTSRAGGRRAPAWSSPAATAGPGALRATSENFLCTCSCCGEEMK